LVYSSNANTRQVVKTSIGRRPSLDLGEFEFHEFATAPALLVALDKQRFDLLILDGEAAPTGGLGLARQLKDEIFNCPPVVVLVARSADKWLATWSRAEASVSAPLDPRELVKAALDALLPVNA
jgi:DNA-binding response OmpR family regulator